MNGKTAVTSAAQRVVRVTESMGTAVSVHAIVSNADEDLAARIDTHTQAAFAQLREVERVFSPFIAESDISRMRDGKLRREDTDARVTQVYSACTEAERATNGRFSAGWQGGWFDPTGYVKGWAVEEAFDAHLRGLLEFDGVLAVGVNAGGDMQLATAPEAAWEWRVGVTHPVRPGEVVATIELRDGAIATSGTAERGAHIIDPRTGLAAGGALSATVVAKRLRDADVWATAAIVAGGDLGWVAEAAHTNGMLVTAHGVVRRWAGGVELVQAAQSTRGASNRNSVPSGELCTIRTVPPARSASSRASARPSP